MQEIVTVTINAPKDKGIHKQSHRNNGGTQSLIAVFINNKREFIEMVGNKKLK